MTYYAVIDTNVLISALLSSHDDALQFRLSIGYMMEILFPCSMMIF